MRYFVSPSAGKTCGVFLIRREISAIIIRFHLFLFFWGVGVGACAMDEADCTEQRIIDCI